MCRLILAGLLAAFALGAAPDEERSPDVTEPPPYEEFVIIPVRVSLLSSADLPEADCHLLTDDDIRRIFGKVNAIWHKAGVHMALESIRREPAARQAKFKLARDLDGPARANLGLFRLLVPEADKDFEGLRVYYLHKFPVNGVWMGDGFAIVQETARLRPVPGGIDEPIPRVTAHELGHALGLGHRQDETNLLASGTTGTLLTAREVERARAHAAKTPGARTVPALRQAARDEADKTRARQLWTWLADLPGPAAEDARAALKALD